MAWDDLDELDKHVLYALQRDARNTSSSDVAERAGVSPSTVRNRIKRPEERRDPRLRPRRRLRGGRLAALHAHRV